jgi:hypothetical protein
VSRQAIGNNLPLSGTDPDELRAGPQGPPPLHCTVFLFSGGVSIRQAVDQACAVVTGIIGVLRSCLFGVVGFGWEAAGLDQVAFLPAMMTDFM